MNLLRPGGRIASTLGLTADAAKDSAQGGDIAIHTIMADPSPQTLTVLAAQAASGALRVPDNP